LIIDSAGGSGYAALVNLAAPGGRIVNYGATAGPPQKLDLFKVFWKQLRLQGSTMGSPEDFASMLKFVEEKRIHPIIDTVLPLEAGNEAIARMESSPQFGKYVLAID
jgi:NADPH:quinone reductase-like Zn-dependent oxidoreductase